MKPIKAMGLAGKLWDFGLSAEQESLARRLHQSSIVIDMVNQHPGGSAIYEAYDPQWVAGIIGDLEPGMRGLSKVMSLPYQLDLEGTSDLIHQWWRASGITVGTVHIPIAEAALLSGPLQGYVDFIALVNQLPWLKLVTTAAEIRQVKAEGMHAVHGYWQPIFGLTNQLSDIDIAYEQGLRVLMLTYNRMDFVGTGCTERVDAGLSMYGVDVVNHCNSRGIIIDTSHCGKATTLDACKLSRAPVCANHTMAAAVFNHSRAKSDEELQAIADTGGVIGVVAVPAFLAAEPTIETLLDHIDYISDKVGWQHVGLGTDSPMQGPKAMVSQSFSDVVHKIGFRKQDKLNIVQDLPGFYDCRDMINITRGLVKRGYSECQIQGILGENFLRVFEAVCG